jgi:hypothetical protein
MFGHPVSQQSLASVKLGAKCGTYSGNLSESLGKSINDNVHVEIIAQGGNLLVKALLKSKCNT